MLAEWITQVNYQTNVLNISLISIHLLWRCKIGVTLDFMTTDGKFGTYISWRTGGIKFKVQLFFEIFFPAGWTISDHFCCVWLVCKIFVFLIFYSERFEPRSHIKRLSLIVRVNVVLNRTVVVDSDWPFDNLCGSHLQSQSELCHVSWWYYTLVIDLTGQLCRDVIDLVNKSFVRRW